MRLKDNIEKLSQFIAAYEEGSFKAASKSILISQPQITRTVQQLEALLDTQLFVRIPTGVKPTYHGEQLYNFSKEIFKKIQVFEFQMRSKSHLKESIINIGSYDSISRYFIPDFIKYFQSLMPQIKINLTSGRSSEILSKLKNNDLDIIIHVGEINDKDLYKQRAYGDKFQLYATKNIEKVYSNNLIAFDGAVAGFDDIVSGNAFDSYYSCQNLETVTNLTLSGIGIGLLPTRVARDHLLAGKLEVINKRLSLSGTHHNIYVVRKKNNSSDSLSAVFNELTHFLELWSK